MDPEATPRELTMTVEAVALEEEFVFVQRKGPPLHHVLGLLLLERAQSMATLLVLAIFVLTFVMQPFRIPSESMEPTLLIGDFLLVNKQVYAPAGVWGRLLPYRGPERGDVVVFHFPLDPDDHVVKRVIGAPGDRIHLRDGVVYRDGVALQEPYLAAAGPGGDEFRDDFPSAPTLDAFSDPGVDAHWWLSLRRSLVHGELAVPADAYFVMGDNREHSRDSRYWGFVPRAKLVGMPMVIYFSVRTPARGRSTSGLADDKLGKSDGNAWHDFARWDRILRVVR